jgi:hypothetical protein
MTDKRDVINAILDRLGDGGTRPLAEAVYEVLREQDRIAVGIHGLVLPEDANVMGIAAALLTQNPELGDEPPGDETAIRRDEALKMLQVAREGIGMYWAALHRLRDALGQEWTPTAWERVEAFMDALYDDGATVDEDTLAELVRQIGTAGES